MGDEPIPDCDDPDGWGMSYCCSADGQITPEIMDQFITSVGNGFITSVGNGFADQPRAQDAFVRAGMQFPELDLE